jgi:hypothetical protein
MHFAIPKLRRMKSIKDIKAYFERVWIGLIQLTVGSGC